METLIAYFQSQNVNFSLAVTNLTAEQMDYFQAMEVANGLTSKMENGVFIISRA